MMNRAIIASLVMLGSVSFVFDAKAQNQNTQTVNRTAQAVRAAPAAVRNAATTAARTGTATAARATAPVTARSGATANTARPTAAPQAARSIASTPEAAAPSGVMSSFGATRGPANQGGDAIDITGQSRNLSMGLLFQRDKDNVSFGSPRTNYRDKITSGQTNY